MGYRILMWLPWWGLKDTEKLLLCAFKSQVKKIGMKSKKLSETKEFQNFAIFRFCLLLNSSIYL